MPSDLSPLFDPPMPGPAQPMYYLQGLVTAWDPVTLENTVVVNGSTFTDLPVQGVAEAASIAAGSVVAIMAAGPTWAITGRFVRPNTTDATDAITRLSQQIYTSTIAGSFETTSSATFTDLATVGPSVDATILASGRALVLLSASMACPNKGGAMGFGVSGASTQAADLTKALALSETEGIGTGVSVGAFFTRLVEVNGLTPGVNTFTAKYARTSGSTAVGFQDRNITVIVL